jgi:hypothetical protein
MNWGTLRRVVWCKLTNVSDVLSASIIRAITTEMSTIFHHITRRNIPEDYIQLEDDKTAKLCPTG